MSTIFQRAGASYAANARRFMAPVRDGLLGWWYLGGLPGDTADEAQARTIKNLANFGDTVALVGAPTIGTGFVEVDVTHSCVTTIAETASFTYMYCGFPTGDTFNSCFLTNQVASSPCVNFYTIGTAPTRASMQVGINVAGTPTLTGVCNMSVTPWTAQKFIANIMDDAGRVAKIRNCTDGTVASFATTNPRSVFGHAMRFGGHTAIVDGVRLGFVALYNRVLSDDEIDATHATVATWRLNKYGDVV
jgi:hypothetical protein